jgi:tetratricopeptide (TPR) repeat protein
VTRSIRLRPALTALIAAAALVLPAAAGARDGVAGPYLAGRLATVENDYAEAASYFQRALISDPGNRQFLENALVASIATGDVARAVPLARRMDEVGGVSQGAAMLTIAELAREGRFADLVAELDAGRSTGTLVDGLVRAWALVGEGRMSDALLAFDAVAAEQRQRGFGLYHKAVALASVGDFEGAEAILSGKASGPVPPTRRGVIAHAQVLSQLERNADARAAIDAGFGENPDPLLERIRAALDAGETLPFDVVTGPADGVAEVYYTVAGALLNEKPDAYTLAYARLAHHVRPGHIDAILLSAAILETQGQYDLATAAYDLIPRDDPAFYAAEIGRAEALSQAGRDDAAIEALRQLAKAFPELPTVWISLGDALRKQELFAEATGAYDRAVALFPEDARGQWIVYFARGITHERQKQWPEAEADFRKALALEPDQPQVLNYLGYGLVELKIKLDEALSMIERAVAARPEDGYIVDSLGWALYRLGRYEEAVAHMERAVELMPIDPVVNDHLGDVYWAVGRKREAEFQWRRALSFADAAPEENPDADPARIRRKLEIGLDKVLAEEGAPPLSVSKNGN